MGEGDPRHEFPVCSRTLFECDGFPMAQPRFRYAYRFWVSEALGKAPHRVPSAVSGRKAGAAVAWGPGAERAPP